MDIPESLRKQHQNWIAAVNNEDIDTYTGIISEDVVWIPPGQQPVVGREAFRQWLEPFLGQFSYDFSITNERFLVSGDYALERASFTSKMTPNSGGDPMEHSGTFVVFWHRDQENSWTIERYIDDTHV